MAQFNLGSMYATGEGVPLDPLEAYKWFSIAARGGGYLGTERVKNEAARARNAMASRLSQMQREAGESRIDQWKATPEPEGVAAVTDLLQSQQQEGRDQRAPTKGSPAEVAARFALGTCYDALDDISRVKSYARLMNWQSLPPDARNIMRPVAAGSDYQAWTVNEDGQTFFVSAHVGNFRGKPAQVCQVFTPSPVEQVIASIGSKVRMSEPQAAEIGLQRNEVYQLLQHPTGRLALLLVARSKEGGKGVVLGFMGVQQ
ncbi:SEL1-like repeat protein [Bradyrhizobium tunisiense]|uniref:SEL1-like repeat protein n=1 Tax=Bradyrhizobium tunisiense TaxID=3278709 RepID=UPI0035D80FE3